MLPAQRIPASLAGCCLLAAGLAASHPAAALTITPYYDGSFTTAQQTAISDAVSTIGALYANTGSVGIVFNQGSGSFLGQSQTADATIGYSSYKSLLTAASSQDRYNTVLSTAVAHLSTGNDANGSANVEVTTADARVALGQNVGKCFNSSGTFVNGCGQAYDGVVTLNTSQPLNYTTAAVAGQYSAINVVEHEVDEILGGGGQGSVLGSGSTTTVGVLDLYRYSAAGTPSLSTSASESYLSVDGGVTDIIGFNQTSGGDYADFNTNDNIQSAFTNSGQQLLYTALSPEYIMMQSIGYDGYVPEPASLALLGSGVLGLVAVRRRKAR